MFLGRSSNVSHGTRLVSTADISGAKRTQQQPFEYPITFLSPSKLATYVTDTAKPACSNLLSERKPSLYVSFSSANSRSQRPSELGALRNQAGFLYCCKEQRNASTKRRPICGTSGYERATYSKVMKKVETWSAYKTIYFIDWRKKERSAKIVILEGGTVPDGQPIAFIDRLNQMILHALRYVIGHLSFRRHQR